MFLINLNYDLFYNTKNGGCPIHELFFLCILKIKPVNFDFCNTYAKS